MRQRPRDNDDYDDDDGSEGDGVEGGRMEGRDRRRGRGLERKLWEGGGGAPSSEGGGIASGGTRIGNEDGRQLSGASGSDRAE